MAIDKRMTYLKYALTLVTICSLRQISFAAELISLGSDVHPWGISGDGSTVVGSSSDVAFRWTRAAGIESLGSGAAQGASYDGSIIVGQTSGLEAFRWTAVTGMVGYGDLPGGPFYSEFRRTSADGSVIAGSGRSERGLEAVRWTEPTGMVGLGDLSGGIFQSQAMDVSADGSVIVGASFSGPELSAFSWTLESTMVPLEGLPGRSVATGVSADGRVVVGQVGIQPFRWTAETGMVALADLPGQDTSAVWAASADGSILVGLSGTKAFIWTQGGGTQSLDGLLSGLGVDMTGWNLYIPTAMSYDGRVIAGYGSNSQGSNQGWIALIPELPEPSTYLLVCAALVVLLSIRVYRLRHLARNRHSLMRGAPAPPPVVYQS